MNILAFDTSLAACSAALFTSGSVAARRFAVMERGHAEALMPMIVEVVSEARMSLAAVDAIAVTVGPGYFTGIRIGLAAARGLALALDRPCIGVTTTEAVAHGTAAEERRSRSLLVALETKRSDVYVQLFSSALGPLTEARALMPDDVPDLVAGAPGPSLGLAGDGGARVRDVLAAAGLAPVLIGGPGVPDAGVVARLAAARYRPGEAPPPQPLYLRPPDAVPPTAGGRLRS